VQKGKRAFTGVIVLEVRSRVHGDRLISLRSVVRSHFPLPYTITLFLKYF